jgi:O-antigen/teichoic acid export membrane protein
MNRKHIKTFSATTFQIITNQFLGLALFILLALCVSKNDFGDLNWSLAVGSTVCIILTFGFDHIVVKKLSAGDNIQQTAGAYLSHAVILSILAVVVMFVHSRLFPGTHQVHKLLLVIFISSLLTFMSSPYKQLANGTEHYWHLAIMSIIGNLSKVIGLLIMLALKRMDVAALAIVFISSGAIELCVCAFVAYTILKRPLKLSFNVSAYKALVKEALPQMGVVLLDSSFARIDWILMGILSTNIFTADYSFAYKAFESSRIPLLIIAPVLLPKLSKLYSREGVFTDTAIKELNSLWKIESVICIIIPLMLNVCWEDLINAFTHNRYGTSTKWVYAILSFSLPMLYMTNYLWTIAFAQGRLKLTFKISAAVTITNFVLNILLIRYFNAVGAAIAFSSSTLLQLILYRATVKERQLDNRLGHFIKTMLLGILIVALFQYIHLFWMLKMAAGLLLFLTLIYALGIYRTNPLKLFKK